MEKKEWKPENITKENNGNQNEEIKSIRGFTFDKRVKLFKLGGKGWNVDTSVGFMWFGSESSSLAKIKIPLNQGYIQMAASGTPTVPEEGMLFLAQDHIYKYYDGTIWQSLGTGSVYVKLDGNETIGGIKTFSNFPVTPSTTPSNDYEVSNKKYVDGKIVSVSLIIVPGTYLYADAASSFNTNSSTYIPKKAIRVTRDGTFTVSFDMYGVAGHPGYGQIWKNGVPYGTERISETGAFQTYNEDLAFVAGDGVSLYVHCDGSNNVFYREFKLQGQITVNAGTVLLDT
jgi:hypothetical protein